MVIGHDIPIELDVVGHGRGETAKKEYSPCLICTLTISYSRDLYMYGVTGLLTTYIVV